MRNLVSIPKTKPIIAVDFDGTLVHNNYPIISNPNTDLIAFILNHRTDFTWILWTCRSGSQLRFAIDYLKEKFGLEFDYVNENTVEKIDEYGNTRKIYADFYLDDKNGSLSDLKKYFDKN